MLIDRDDVQYYQKQPPRVVYENRCFPVNFAKFKKTYFYRVPYGDCFCTILTMTTMLIFSYLEIKKKWRKITTQNFQSETTPKPLFIKE